MAHTFTVCQHCHEKHTEFAFICLETDCFVTFRNSEALMEHMFTCSIEKRANIPGYLTPVIRLPSIERQLVRSIFYIFLYTSTRANKSVLDSVQGRELFWKAVGRYKPYSLL